MISSKPAGHHSVNPYLSGYGCGCDLSGALEKKPAGFHSKGKVAKYVRFCAVAGTPLDTPSFEDATSVYPLVPPEAEQVSTSTVYEVLDAVTKSSDLFGKGLADKGFDALWLLVKKPKAKEPDGWVLGAVRMRMDNWPKRTQKLPDVDYQGLDAVLCSLAETQGKVQSQSELDASCEITERKLEVMDAYLKGKPDPLEKPEDKPKEEKTDTPPPPAKQPSSGMGLLALAVGGVALYYLLAKRGRT